MEAKAVENKYFKTWDQFVEEHPEIDERILEAMAPKMQSYEGQMFGFVMFLLM